MNGPERRRPWRRWNAALHRDLGYLAVGLTVVYAVSGVAVNHADAWNPNYVIEKVERRFPPFALAERDAAVAALVPALALPGAPREAVQTGPDAITLFYDGLVVEAHPSAGAATLDSTRDRALFRDVNLLHLNHPKGAWTVVADAYAAVLLLLAVTGLFILRGRPGLGGRGKWLVAAGTAIPLVALAWYRWF
jgi:hypothetical protein